MLDNKTEFELTLAEIDLMPDSSTNLWKKGMINFYQLVEIEMDLENAKSYSPEFDKYRIEKTNALKNLELNHLPQKKMAI